MGSESIFSILKVSLSGQDSVPTTENCWKASLKLSLGTCSIQGLSLLSSSELSTSDNSLVVFFSVGASLTLSLHVISDGFGLLE